jgi:hypothetical protein
MYYDNTSSLFCECADAADGYQLDGAIWNSELYRHGWSLGDDLHDESKTS